MKVHYIKQHPEENVESIDEIGTVPRPAVDKKKKIQCDICLKRFARKANIEYHMGSAHMKNKKIYTCLKCGKNFTKSSSFKKHIENHKRESQLHFDVFCDECGLSNEHHKNCSKFVMRKEEVMDETEESLLHFDVNFDEQSHGDNNGASEGEPNEEHFAANVESNDEGVTDLPVIHNKKVSVVDAYPKMSGYRNRMKPKRTDENNENLAKSISARSVPKTKAKSVSARSVPKTKDTSIRFKIPVSKNARKKNTTK